MYLKQERIFKSSANTKEKIIKLINGKNPTRSFDKLVQSTAEGGAEVHTRGGGWSDYPILAALTAEGLVECYPGGPRGGSRWRITTKGLTALAEARRELEWSVSGGPEAKLAAEKLARQISKKMKLGRDTASASDSRSQGL